MRGFPLKYGMDPEQVLQYASCHSVPITRWQILHGVQDFICDAWPGGGVYNFRSPEPKEFLYTGQSNTDLKTRIWSHFAGFRGNGDKTAERSVQERGLHLWVRKKLTEAKDHSIVLLLTLWPCCRPIRDILKLENGIQAGIPTKFNGKKKLSTKVTKGMGIPHYVAALVTSYQQEQQLALDERQQLLLNLQSANLPTEIELLALCRRKLGCWLLWAYRTNNLLTKGQNLLSEMR